MNVELFKKISDSLLRTHYCMDLADTDLCEDQIVQACIENKERPYEVVNELAQRLDLDRYHHNNVFGNSKQPLTENDEARAIIALNGLSTEEWVGLNFTKGVH